MAATGKILKAPDAYSEPLFNRAVGEQTGYRTHNLLCAPIMTSSNQTFAVADEQRTEPD